MATFAAGALGIDFDSLDLGPLATGTINGMTATSQEVRTNGIITQFFGTGFQFASSGPPISGTINRIVVATEAGLAYDIIGLTLSAATFRGWVVAGDSAAAKAGIFGEADSFVGSSLDDLIRGFAGSDTLNSGAGADFADGGDGDDQVFAGAGNDTIVDPGGANYLRGDEGDDFIAGGANFDDINGNMGNDTASGGPGDDWVVGGKDDDLIFGDDGGDLVYGNLGNDTCDGGNGADTIRGGQQNDSLSGGGGNDFVSGDRGDDTMTGGMGADIFHSSSDAGVDRVLDFNVAQGDRVQLDPGTTFTIAQVGADTVVTMSAGSVILVGVSMSVLTAASVFVG